MMRNETPVPEGWQVMRLSDVACERNQRANSGPQAEVFSVTKHSGFVRSLEYFGRQVFSRDTSNYKIVRRGDLAYATIHLDEGSLGILRDSEIGMISPMYTVFEVDRAQAEPEFLFSLMKLPQMVAKYTRIGEGSVHRRKSISFENLSRLSMVIPDLAEQRRVLAVLDSIDEAIERTEAVITATERLRDALLHELLTRGVPGWHSEWKHAPGIGTIPADWEVVRLGEVGQWLSGGTPSKARPDFWSGDIPWISPKGMKTRTLSASTDSISKEGATTGSRVVPPGTILVVVRGMILAHLFPAAITRVACAYNQDIRALICHEGFDSEYILAALEWQRPRLLSLPTPSTHGTMRVVTEDLENVSVPRPPTEEQLMISQLLKGVDEALEPARRARYGLHLLKESTADALLTGQVRV